MGVGVTINWKRCVGINFQLKEISKEMQKEKKIKIFIYREKSMH